MSDYLHFFTEEEAGRIVRSIEEAEQLTSGEIRVHVEASCKKLPYQRAVHVFEKLGMCDTRERNGILFYLGTDDHDFAVIGDAGIHDKVGEDYWLSMKDDLEKEFRAGDFCQGLCAAIQRAGQSLKTYFPRSSQDQNEIDNSISSGHI
jgi:uncharacterized membrane protein